MKATVNGSHHILPEVVAFGTLSTRRLPPNKQSLQDHELFANVHDCRF